VFCKLGRRKMPEGLSVAVTFLHNAKTHTINADGCSLPKTVLLPRQGLLNLVRSDALWWVRDAVRVPKRLPEYICDAVQPCQLDSLTAPMLVLTSDINIGPMANSPFSVRRVRSLR
jgi:hypothetical protein